MGYYIHTVIVFAIGHTIQKAVVIVNYIHGVIVLQGPPECCRTLSEHISVLHSHIHPHTIHCLTSFLHVHTFIKILTISTGLKL